MKNPKTPMIPIIDHGVDIIGDEWEEIDEGCSDNISSGNNDDNDDDNSNN